MSEYEFADRAVTWGTAAALSATGGSEAFPSVVAWELGRQWGQCCPEVTMLGQAWIQDSWTAHTLAYSFSSLGNGCVGVLRLLKLQLSGI